MIRGNLRLLLCSESLDNLSAPEVSEVHLPFGASTIFGRGKVFGIHDQRVSRRHLEFVVSAAGDAVSVEALGLNSSRLERCLRDADGDQDQPQPQQLQPGQPVGMHNGDRVYLVGSMYGYRLDGLRPTLAAPRTSPAPVPDEGAPAASHKRRRSSQQPQDEGGGGGAAGSSASGPSSASSASSKAIDSRAGRQERVWQMQQAAAAEADRRRKCDAELASQRLLIEVLAADKAALEARSRQLQALEAEVGQQRYMPGELEALAAVRPSVKRYVLRPSRQYDNDASQHHLRAAESEFYRLAEAAAAAGRFQVTQVEYVVSPLLVKRFERLREHLDATLPEHQMCLAFHGTANENLTSIVENGFFTSDSGTLFSSKAEYVSPWLAGGRGAARQRLLLSRLLLGRSRTLPDPRSVPRSGAEVDSHVSVDGREYQYLMFNTDAILPVYIVHFCASTGIYKYDADAYALTSATPGRGAAGFAAAMVPRRISSADDDYYESADSSDGSDYAHSDDWEDDWSTSDEAAVGGYDFDVGDAVRKAYAKARGPKRRDY
eukprot:TRINITY_DN666_c0_g1_i1.p1 TRINITY_DN666_c0_g1~~TRINITY_DN666_c0_g1_i1.p1  ORF type:complete len:547 (+),score=155.66 TRINITY_DN666_c0_g1_i1:665-2305(+)